MRSAVALAVAAPVAMLLQTTVLPSIGWLPVVPDLLLVLAVYLGVRHHGAAGAAGAFLLGCFLDAFSGTLPGVNAFALTAAYAAAQVVARHLWIRSGLPVMAVVFLGGCVRAVATGVLVGLVATHAPLWQHIVRYGFVEATAAALVGPAVFAVMRRLLGAP